MESTSKVKQKTYDVSPLPKDRVVYTIPEVSAALGFSRTHFYQLAKTGEAPKVTKLGEKSLIFKEVFDAWVADQIARTLAQ